MRLSLKIHQPGPLSRLGRVSPAAVLQRVRISFYAFQRGVL